MSSFEFESAEFVTPLCTDFGVGKKIREGFCKGKTASTSSLKKAPSAASVASDDDHHQKAIFFLLFFLKRIQQLIILMRMEEGGIVCLSENPPSSGPNNDFFMHLYRLEIICQIVGIIFQILLKNDHLKMSFFIFLVLQEVMYKVIS